MKKTGKTRKIYRLKDYTIDEIVDEHLKLLRVGKIKYIPKCINDIHDSMSFPNKEVKKKMKY